jgi:hypothetical protein
MNKEYKEAQRHYDREYEKKKRDKNGDGLNLIYYSS